MVRLATQESGNWSTEKVITQATASLQRDRLRLAVSLPTKGDSAQRGTSLVGDPADAHQPASKSPISTELCAAAVFFGAIALMSLFMRFPALASGSAAACLFLAIGSVHEARSKDATDLRKSGNSSNRIAR